MTDGADLGRDGFREPMAPAPVILPASESTSGGVHMDAWPGSAYPLGATFDGSGTNFALFSEAAERVELCLFDDDGNETRIELTRGRRLRLALLPAAGPARSALRLPGPRPVRPRERGCGAIPRSCCSTRTPRRPCGEIDWDPSLFSYDFGDPDVAQRRRLGAAHDARRRHQPVLRLGRRPPPRRPVRRVASSTRPT